MKTRSEIMQAIQAHRNDIKRKYMEIGTHRKDIIQLKRDLNTKPSLVPDLLHLIFLEYLYPAEVQDIIRDPHEPVWLDDPESEWDSLSDDDTSDYPVGKFPPHWQWLLLTRVCHAWRAVALSSPLLWCRVDSNLFWYPHIIQKFILLSGEALLNVTMKCRFVPLDWEWNKLRKSLGVVLREAVRLRSLTLVVHRGVFDRVFTNNDPPPSFSRLESFNLVVDHGELDDVPLPLHGFRTIMTAGLPALCRISLSDVDVDWKLLYNLPTSVTYIKIWNDTHFSFDGTMNDVLRFLRKLTDLKTLILHCCLPPPAPMTIGLVHLSKIERCTIMDESDCGISLFKSLVLPLNTLTHIELLFYPSEDESKIPSICSSALSHVRRMYEGGFACAVARFSVDESCDTDYASFGLLNYRTEQFRLVMRPFYGGYDEVSYTVSLRYLYELMGVAPEDPFSRFITTLFIEINDYYARNEYLVYTMERILQVMKAVEMLIVERPGNFLLDVLQPRQNGLVLVPRLSRLRLQETMFVDDIGDYPEELGYVEVDALCECLEARQACGSGIDILELDSSSAICLTDPDGVRGRLEALKIVIEGWEDMEVEEVPEEP